jgi:hypothetical protein
MARDERHFCVALLLRRLPIRRADRLRPERANGRNKVARLAPAATSRSYADQSAMSGIAEVRERQIGCVIDSPD